MLENTSTT
ncbi:hypothetical protein LINPERHAP2_LOCUS11655 [Linum perenne]